ncbi:MAG: hypothetical protein LBK92_03820 [Endomicrobium sp.]|jgi:hypothetical protein|nr:hypothetical protein [Endomicrobium sp.]
MQITIKVGYESCVIEVPDSFSASDLKKIILRAVRPKEYAAATNRALGEFLGIHENSIHQYRDVKRTWLMRFGLTALQNEESLASLYNKLKKMPNPEKAIRVCTYTKRGER